MDAIDYVCVGGVRMSEHVRTCAYEAEKVGDNNKEEIMDLVGSTSGVDGGGVRMMQMLSSWVKF